MYTSRVWSAGSRLSRSSPQRNAASVLPLPVGAEMSTCSPPAMAGHASAWAGVGPSKARSNQSRTVGVKAESGDGGTVDRGYPAGGAHVFGLPHSRAAALRAAEGVVGGVPALRAGGGVRLEARPVMKRP